MGDAAKNQAANNPSGTFYDSKRLLGHRYDDVELQVHAALLAAVVCFFSLQCVFLQLAV